MDNIQVGSKRCSRCKEIFPLADYCKDSGRPDGLALWCSACRSQNKKSYVSRNKEKVTALGATYYARNREEITAKRAEKKLREYGPGDRRLKRQYVGTGVRICPGCETPKKLEDFPPDTRYADGHKSRCKECENAYNRGWYRNNYEPHPLVRIEVDPKVKKARIQHTRLVRQYGLSRDEYLAMLEQQNNCCLSCGCEFNSKNGSRPCVDHSHDKNDGRVRGILCNNCNTSLGLLGEDADRARALAVYIENYCKPSTETL